MINFLIYAFLVCDLCFPKLSNEALAIAACESGDTVSLGSHKWFASNINTDGTIDGGAFQFNSYWIWNTENRWVLDQVAEDLGVTSDYFADNWPSAKDAPPVIQYLVFKHVWNNGYGWENWSASKSCWSQWIQVNGNGKAYFKP